MILQEGNFSEALAMLTNSIYADFLSEWGFENTHQREILYLEVAKALIKVKEYD